VPINFFYILLATAIHPVSVNRTHNPQIVRCILYHWAIAALAKSPSPLPRCQVMLWCGVGGYWGTNDTGKASIDYFPWFHAKPFLTDFDRRSNVNLEQTEPCLLACRQMSSQRALECDSGNGFVWRGRCREWGTIALQVSVLKKPWFKINIAAL